MIVYQIWCEWDIGLEDVVFRTEESAWANAKQALVDCKIDDDFDDLKADGYIGLERLKVLD